MDRLLISLRYLAARPISLVSMLGVLVGFGAIVVVDSVMNGFLFEQRAILRGTNADVAVVLPEGVRSDATAVARVLELCRSTEGLAAATPRVEWPCLYRRDGPGRGPESTQPLSGFHFVQLVGIDARHEVRVSRLEHFLEHDAGEGSGRIRQVARVDDPFWFDPDDEFWRSRLDPKVRNWPLIPVIFGDSLARLMGLAVGDVLSTATFGDREDDDGRFPMRSRKLVVCGTFRTLDAEFDYTRALAPLPQVLDFMGTDVRAAEIACRAAPGCPEPVLKDRLVQALAPAGLGAADVETWLERKAVLLRAVENERRLLDVVLFFVVVVAAFSLLVTLYMMVSEKEKDIGILTSLGASSGHVASVFFCCGLIVTLTGLVAGLSAGLLLTWNINPVHDWITRWTGASLFDPEVFMFSSIPAEVDPVRLAWFALGTLLCSTLFTVFPSARAARRDAVEALRHG